MKRPEILRLHFFNGAALDLAITVNLIVPTECTRLKLKNSRFLFIFFTTFTISASALAESWGLVLQKEGSGLGQVCVVYDERNDCQVDDVGTETNIELNEHINLRATPNSGSHFVQWALPAS